MSFKNYRKGTKRVLDQALENSRHVYANYKISLSKHPCNQSWLRLSEQFPAKDKWCSAEFHL